MTKLLIAAVIAGGVYHWYFHYTSGSTSTGVAVLGVTCFFIYLGLSRA